VLAMRWTDCEHARGPAFLLSDKDRAALSEQLARDRQDSLLEGMICAGWFLSHSSGEIALGDSDLEIYATFFPAPWQVTLVIRPGRAGAMRAGFFVRESDGAVNSGRRYMDFNFPDRLAGVLDSTPRRERRSPLDRRGSGLARPNGGAAAAAAPAPRFLPIPPPSRKWGWLLAWLVTVIGLIVFGLGFFTTRGVAEPVSLSVADSNGQLRIEWNHSANTVAAATRGYLEIVDGQDTRVVALTPQDLDRGRFTYARSTGDIEVRMTVVDVGGARIQEASRFLGRPPAKPQGGELDTFQRRSDELEAEVSRLRRENQQQTKRIRQLERTLHIPRPRLGIAQDKP
jgi:hypothetical protein